MVITHISSHGCERLRGRGWNFRRSLDGGGHRTHTHINGFGV